MDLCVVWRYGGCGAELGESVVELALLRIGGGQFFMGVGRGGPGAECGFEKFDSLLRISCIGGYCAEVVERGEVCCIQFQRAAEFFGGIVCMAGTE